MPRIRMILLTWLLALAFIAGIRAQDKLYLPVVARRSSEPDQALRSIRHPDDLAVSLFAAEPRLANPVAFSVDPRGRFYVVETFRLHSGVTDNRSHMYWLDDDLASRTVADREAMHRKWLGKDVASYAVDHDRIRLIEDRDGDGKADHDATFADGFQEIVTGLAAGVLPTKDGVYFACIPDLWLLKDTDGDGKTDARTVLSTGYGVHVAFSGHDLHGLIMGPDGRLYFSIGDRGLHVVNKEGKVVSCPDTGAVLRCDPDGSNLELFATGLRNPQELAFDNYGNLFTVDNNSDSGDKARVVHLVEGGDSGWRVGYQYLEKPVSRGPWNAERLWHPRPENTAAYLLPPLMNLSDGPSGLTFDPGVTLLPARFKDHFFLADFRGGAGQSGIRSFAVEPDGASFKVVDTQQPIWSVLATDVDFGPDGGLYVSDWVDGWDKTGKGRIWRFGDPARAGDIAVKEVKSILAQGMSGKPVDELGRLLAHDDRRVRLAAQFELVGRQAATKASSFTGGVEPDRKAVVLDKFTEVARNGPGRIARLHGVWGLGQLGRTLPLASDALEGLRGDADPEIRAQVARLLGEVVPGRSSPGGRLALVAQILGDPSPRVRSFAAQGLGKLRDPAAVAPLLRLLESNADRDPYIRHAAATALARVGDPGTLVGASVHPSASVRLGALLALRRVDPSRLGAFLKDARSEIVLEAARGIYDDDPKPSPAMAELAALAARPDLDGPTLRRAVNANARLGGKGRAEALARLASRGDQPADIRVEALELLGDWAKPSGRDRLTGLWRPYPARPKAEAAGAIGPRFRELLKPGPEAVRLAAIGAIGELGIGEAVAALVALVSDPKVPGATRVEAIEAIERIGDPRLADAVSAALDATDSRVRAEGQRLVAKTQPERAVPLLAKVLKGGSTRERQGAMAVLADLGRPEADALIARHLKAKDLPLEVELDVIEAASKRSTVPAIKSAIDAYGASQAKGDPLAGYRPILVGGDLAKGQALFRNNAAVYCIRCHKLDGQGGEVGPDLTGIGKKQTREYLATSLVHPNAAIAQGFETVVVSLADGRVVSGVFKSEDGKALHLVSVEGKPIDVPKSEVEDRRRGPSAMPDDIVKKLSKSDLRDLVEFLATRK